MNGPEAASALPAVAVEHLGLQYPGPRERPPVAVLRDVSVTVPRGGALTVVGPSGSGKSSFLRCLNRLEEPTTGSVRFHGKDIRILDPLTLRRRMALVAQTPVLFDGSVRDNLRTHPPGTGVDLSEGRLRASLGEVGLAPELLDRDGATLSGGEKQRVTLARALLADPEVLLLDEPASALDPPNAARVADTVSTLRQARGLTVVVVTHQPELVRRLGGRLLYLVGGAVEAEAVVDGADGGVGDPRLRAFLAGRAELPGEAAGR
jgi:putative ABC transport system ATP-binding protein